MVSSKCSELHSTQSGQNGAIWLPMAVFKHKIGIVLPVFLVNQPS